MYQAQIKVMPLKELLDPQGKAVAGSLKDLGLAPIKDVRIGKHIVLKVEANSKEEACKMVETACQKLLANLVMESYEFELKEL